MSYTQTNRIVKAKIVLTPLELKKPKKVDGFCYHYEIPPELLPDYKRAIATHGDHFIEVSTLFQQLYPSPPYTARDFLHFLKKYWGISSEVISFKNTSEWNVKGAWCWDNEERNSVTIHVEESLSPEQKKMTVIHECFHIIQDLDQSFAEILTQYPQEIYRRVTERIAEKSAVETVLPRIEFNRCRRQNMSNGQIADLYQVSFGLVRNF